MALLALIILLMIFAFYGGLAISPLFWILFALLIIVAVGGRGRFYL